jgi:hypothetical protein
LTESVVITALELNFFTLWGRTKRLIFDSLILEGSLGKGETPVGEGSRRDPTGHSPRKLAGSHTGKRAFPQ